MYSVVLAAFGIMTLATIVNITLTLALVRKLRTDPHSRHDHAGDPFASPVLPAAGSSIGEVRLTFNDGQTVTHDDLSLGSILMIVMSTTCQPCRKLAATLEGNSAITRSNTVLLVVDDNDDVATTQFVDLLPGHLRWARTETEVASALGVNGFPGIVLLTDGVVIMSSHTIEPVLARMVSGKQLVASRP